MQGLRKESTTLQVHIEVVAQLIDLVESSIQRPMSSTLVDFVNVDDGTVHNPSDDSVVVESVLDITESKIKPRQLSISERDAISMLLASKHRRKYSCVKRIIQKYNVHDSFEVARVATTMAGYGEVLGLFSASLRDNEKLVSMAVQNDGDALEHASTKLRDNEEVVMRALRSSTHSCNDFSPLKYASERLRGIRRVVKAGIEQDGNAIQFASKTLRGDAEIIATACRHLQLPVWS